MLTPPLAPVYSVVTLRLLNYSIVPSLHILVILQGYSRLTPQLILMLLRCYVYPRVTPNLWGVTLEYFLLLEGSMLGATYLTTYILHSCS